MTIEAMKQGQEILRVTPEGEFIWHQDADRLIEEGDFSNSPAMPHILRKLRKAIQEEALRNVQRLGQEIEQEPVEKHYVDGGQIVYPSPQRQWIGLTPQERDEINEQVYGAVPHHVAFHAAIEAKLKEKNT